MGQARAELELRQIAKSYDGQTRVVHGIDLGVRQGEFSIPWPTISAALIVAIVPIALLIAVFQERVVGGLTQGGLKG